MWEHSLQSSPCVAVPPPRFGFRSRVRWDRHHQLPISEDAGFVLLLAFFGALALLLSSLSIQTAALQSRSSDFSLRQRVQREDWLSSAAHVVAARLHRYPCLLPLLLAEWDGPEATCVTADAVEQLRHGTLPSLDAEAGSYTITGYSPVRQPSVDLTLIGAELELQWQPKRGPLSLRRFRIALLPGPRLGGIQP